MAARNYAVGLEQRWRFAQLRQRVEELRRAHRYDEALSALDEGLAEGWSVDQRQGLVQFRQRVSSQVELKRARAALAEGRHEEARTVLTALLAEKNLPRSTTAEARRLLARLEPAED